MRFLHVKNVEQLKELQQVKKRMHVSQQGVYEGKKCEEQIVYDSVVRCHRIVPAIPCFLEQAAIHQGCGLLPCV